MAENLSAASIMENLRTRLIGRKVIYYPRLDSTNDTARQEAQNGAPEGTVVVADEQIAGKGRIKRVWLTPRGNIALSIIFYPPVAFLPCLIMLASLAVSRSIEAVTGLKPQIKWPNDVLINGKKVCGILSESDVRGNTVAHAVVGIGINMNLNPADFPGIAATATSLAAELGKDVSRLELIRRLLIEADRLYQDLPSGEAIYQEWHARLVTLGRRVQVKSGADMLYGIAESVDKDGSLLLRHADGSSTRIVAGDVVLRDYQ